MEMTQTNVLVILLTILVTVVGYLLAERDQKNEKVSAETKAEHDRQIAALWLKHNEDAHELQELRILIAKDHYIKPELDAKFTELSSTFKTGFDQLGNKFDRLAETLIAHIVKDETK